MNSRISVASAILSLCGLKVDEDGHSRFRILQRDGTVLAKGLGARDVILAAKIAGALLGHNGEKEGA